MTLLKDAIEKLTPAISPSQSRTEAKPEPGGLRSDAVSLEVPVKVHGSRVAQVAGDGTQHTEPFEEQTSTMIVFPQGGVLKMSTAVSVGQMVVVTNLKSGQDSICRIVKVRAFANTQSYVEVEFTHRQVGYWGVQFSSDPMDSPGKPSSLPSPLTVHRTPIAPAAAFEAPAAQARPVAAGKTIVQQTVSTKEPSLFVKFGEQEDVQLAASLTTSSRSGSAKPMDSRASATPVVEPVKLKPVAAPPAPSVEELRGDTQTAVQEFAQGEKPGSIHEDLDPSSAPALSAKARVFGETTNLGGIANAAVARPAGREMFAAAEPEKTASEGRSSRTLVLTAAAVVLLAAAGAGAYFFLYQHSDLSATVAATSGNAQPGASLAASASPVVDSSQQTAQTAASVAQQVHAPSALRSAPARSTAAPAAPAARPREHAAEETKAERDNVSSQAVSSAASASTEASTSPGASEQHHPSGNAPNLFGALNAHPVASHSAAHEGEAPVLPADEPGLAVLSPSVAGPAAPRAQVLTSPRLIASVLPVYPDFAKERNVDGTVVIQATIEANGTVGAMKVLSGPTLLRQAALQAVRQWRYEPGKVDGQSAVTETTVSVRFAR